MTDGHVVPVDQRGAHVHHVVVPEAPEHDALDGGVREEEAQGRVVVGGPQTHVLLPHVQLRHPHGQPRLGQVVQAQLGARKGWDDNNNNNDNNNNEYL